MHLGETLSSDTLFHFTGKREYLENILERGFYPRYCTEDLSMFTSAFGEGVESFEFGIPMVCFCDIPLSKVKEHVSIYKGYGIGCTKAWGIEHGVTPLVYVKPTSETVLGIQNALSSLRNLSNISEENGLQVGKVGSSLMRLMKYIKPYEGRFEHNGQIFEKKRFYDEREWRYVPHISNENSEAHLPWISKELLNTNITNAKSLLGRNDIWPQEFLGDIPWTHKNLNELPDILNISDTALKEKLYEVLRQELNTKISENQDLRLPVDPLTIKYIIVEKEEDVEPIVDLLSKRFKDYSHATVKRLLTRIITLEQIIDDF